MGSTTDINGTATNAGTLHDAFYRLRKDDHNGITFVKNAADTVYYSYRHFFQRALETLYNLQQQGVHAGDEVLFQTEDNEQQLICFWACVLGGIIPVPVSVGAQADHKLKLLKIWEHLRHPHLLCDTGHLQRLQDYTTVIGYTSLFAAMEAACLPLQEICTPQPVPGHMVPVTPDTIAYIQYSSGSTGDPKGVILTHANLVANTSDIAARSKIGADDKMLSWMPLTHDMGLICFHLTGICAGIPQYIMPTDLFIRRPLLWMELAHRYQATLLYSPNFGYQYFLGAYGKAPVDWNLSGIRMIYNGAEYISADIANRFLDALQQHGLQHAAMSPGYGLAEASVAVTLPDPGDGLLIYQLHRQHLSVGDKVQYLEAGEEEHGITFASVGYPIDHCAVRITDDGDQLLSEGHVGHIQITGANVTAGYYNNPAPSAKIFTEDNWLRTGDLGLMRQGRLLITGRAKNMIIINGQNYYPQDIERAAITIAGVETGKVVACGIRSGYTEALVIFVLFKGAAKEFIPYVAAIRTAVADRLGLVADSIIAIKKIPKTTSGKIQHYKLAESYREGLYAEQLRETGQQNSNTNLWEALTAEYNITPTTDFLQAGLSSLQLTRLSARIREATGTAVSVADLFAHPSLEKVQAALKNYATDAVRSVPVSADAAYYPLAPSQQRFWLFDLYSPGHSAYNLSFAFGIKGALQTPALQRAIAALTARHSSLRTVFRLQQDMPVQLITDIPGTLSTESATTAQVADIAAAEADYAFNLATGPLYRWRLVQTHHHEYTLFFTIHHIITDGWSVSLLFKELRLLYTAFADQKDNPLPTLPLQYKDCIAWQQAQLQQHADKDLAFWKDTLAHMMPLALPAEKSRPAQASYKGAMISFSFDADLTSRLRQFSREHDLTLFMTLLSAINLLLYRYTGQEDITIGTDVTGRNHQDMDSQSGCFINALCVRNTIDPQQNFLHLCQSVKAQLIAGFEHQQYPFHWLASELPEAHPFFQVLVLFQNFEEGNLHLTDDLQIVPLEPVVTTSYTDLQFEFFDNDAQLSCRLRYDTELYSHELAERLGSHLSQLMSGLLVDTPVAQLPMLTASEQLQIATWNDTRVTYPGNSTVIDRVIANARLTPMSIALQMEEETITYQQLDRDSKHIAACLRSRYQVKTGDRIALLMQRGPAMVVAMIAIMRAGAVYVPFDPEYSHARIRVLLQDSNAALLYSDHTSQGFLPDIPVFIHQQVSAPDMPEQALLPEDTAYIMYTSGSTGTPKGVLIPHAALADYVSTFTGYFTITPQDGVVQQASLAFDTSLEEIFPALCTGATLYIARGGGRDIAGLQQLLQEKPVTVLSTTPLVLNELNRQPECVANLRCIISGGDVLLPAYINKLLERTIIYNTYGPVETTVCALYHPVSGESNAGILGTPIANRQVYLLDAGQQLVPVGIAGEICIAGAGVAAGYLNRPEETARQFISHPLAPGERLYRTGDMGKWLPDGRIVFLGRRDEQVKVRGYRIEISEITSLLLLYPEVEDVVVTAPYRPDGSRCLAAYLVAPEKTDMKEVRAYLLASLPAYMVPDYLVCLPALPLLTNGKVNRQQLPDVFSLPNNRYEAPVTPAEISMAVLWEEILGQQHIGVHDNFFGLGGQSLKAMQIIAGVEQRMGKTLKFRDVFTHPTIAALCRHLEHTTYTDVPAVTHIPAAAWYPMSAVQERFCVLDQLSGDTAPYNLIWAYHITGVLQVPALQEALQHLVMRHEILRTYFPVIDGVPVQCPVEQPRITIDELEMSPAEGAAYIRTLAGSRFDLQHGPLLKALLLKEHGRVHTFCLAMHHIITDAWSMDLLADELTQLYNTFSTGSPVSLPALSFQYRDYAAWHRRLLESPGMQVQEEYWRQQLLAPLPETALPLDFERPAQPTFEGRCIPVVIAGDTYKALQQLSAGAQTGLFAALLSLVKVLIFKYTGQQETMIGIPVSGRTHAHLAQMAGCFVNTLPLRISMPDDLRFDTLLKNTQQLLLTAQEHQQYPFEKMVQLARSIHNHQAPVFEVMVSYRNAAATVLQQMQGISLTPVTISKVTSQFDLCVDVADDGAALHMQFEYNTALFKDATIAAMVNHFDGLLQAVCNGHSVIKDLAYLSAGEEHRLLYGYNNSAIAFDTTGSLPACFTQQVLRSPAAVALVTPEGPVTYHELESRSNQLAHYLCSLHIPQLRVGVLLRRNADMIVTLLGILKAGATYVPIDTDHPEERIKWLISDSQVQLVICNDTHSYEMLKASANCYWLPEMRAAWHAFPHTRPETAVAPDDTAYILYTSGSTGQPKGVMVPHRAMYNYVQAFSHYFGITDTDIVIQQSSLSFDTAVEEIFPVLCNGGKLVLFEPGGKDIKKLAATIVAEKVTLLSATPMVLHALGNIAFDRQSLRTVISGGERLRAADIAAFFGNAAVYNTYGPTECTICAAYHQVTHLTENMDIIGQPVPNVHIYILDEQLQLLPTGVKGEICIGGAGVALGYWQQPALTSQQFVRHPYIPGEIIYRSGDTGYRLEDGRIVFAGRKDTQIKLRGYRIEPAEIERALHACAGVSNAVVKLQQGSGETPQLAAYVVMKDGYDFDAAAIRATLIRHLPVFMLPSYFLCIAALPLTVNGKTDYDRLPPISAASPDEPTVPLTAVEDTLIAFFRHALRAERVSATADFFELGGHSISAMQLVAEINRQFGVLISLRDIFLYPRIQSLAAYIQTLRPQMDMALYPAPEQPYYPLSYAQRRLWIAAQTSGYETLYHMPAAYIITGALNIDALNNALQMLVARHEVLRTFFVVKAGIPYQQLHPVENSITVTVTDGRLMKGDEVRTFVDAYLQQPFDLMNGPLMRTGVVQLSDLSAILLFNIHHIISDGHTSGILLQELTQLYNAALQQAENPLPAFILQYKDYAWWQQQLLAGPQHAALQSYWQQQLQGAVPPDFPLDYPRGAAITYDATTTTVQLPETLYQAIKLLAQEQQVTLFMLLSAAFHVLLYKYTGTEDMITGTVVSGRHRKELTQQAGIYVNTIACRIHCDRKAAFIHLLQHVKQTLLLAYEHQQYPFDLLIDDLNIKTPRNRHPLFDMMLMMENEEDQQDLQGMEGVTATPYPLENYTGKYELTYAFIDTANTVRIRMDYNHLLFRPGTISLLAARYIYLLEQIAEAPQNCADDFTIQLQEAPVADLFFNLNSGNY
jgi:tyrocidine synthetase III